MGPGGGVTPLPCAPGPHGPELLLPPRPSRKQLLQVLLGAGQPGNRQGHSGWARPPTSLPGLCSSAVTCTQLHPENLEEGTDLGMLNKALE